MVNKFMLSLLFVVLMASTLFAQTSVAVDIDKATLVWQASVGGGQVGEYKVKCGPTTGNYTQTTAVVATQTSVPVKNVISGIGVWFCAVTASNQFGESGPSNEISFEAGTKPNNPTGLILQSN